MQYIEPRVRKDREATLLGLAAAYQHRDVRAFEGVVRPDMKLTLTGSSRFAGSRRGFDGVAHHLELLRDVLSLFGARRPVWFEHRAGETVFHQVMVVSGPRHDVEMMVDFTVRYGDDDLIECFLIEPEDQGLFDYVVDSSVSELST